MTRKDFEAIAHILRVRVEDSDPNDRAVLLLVTSSLAGYLSTTNPRFDRGRFMRASGF